MMRWSTLVRWPVWSGAGALAACLLLFSACDGTKRLEPSPDPAAPSTLSFDGGIVDWPNSPPTSPPAAPPPPPPPPPPAPYGEQPGILFGSFDLPYEMLGQLHSGAYRTPSPESILKSLAKARAAGARLVLNLSGSEDRNIVSNRVFSLTKWKGMVDRFKRVDFSSYIEDGTFVGHFLIDEPTNTSRWGRNGIAAATVEEMARYSKQLWPNLRTMARVVPSWLAEAGISYQNLDAAWAQYSARKGEVTQWISDQAGAAQNLHLGLVVSLNILNGGDGSSRLRGTSSGKYRMSANELRAYGNALLDQSSACAFLMWRYDWTFFQRADIRQVMQDLSDRARNHAATACSG